MNSGIMSEFTKKLPNILTSLRVVLALVVNYYITKHFSNVLIPIIICIAIFLTDYFDGKIARNYGYESKVGAILDVLADLFYIVISYIILCYFNILPLWFLFIILFKFMEFIVTSNIIKKFSGKKSILIFDFLGRVVAVIFYIIPMFTYVTYNLVQAIYFYLINLGLYVITFTVFIASSYRILMCLNGYKTVNSTRKLVIDKLNS